MRKLLILIIGFVFTQGVIHNLGHPVTPAFVRSLGIEDFMFGVFFAAMSFGLMIGGPLWGSLSDKGHKKAYIILGLTLYSIGQLGFGYAGNQQIMVLFRFLSGFGVVSSMTIMTSLLIAHSKVEERPKYLAYFAAAFTLGSSFGYWIGGFISTQPFFKTFLGTSDLKVMFLIQSVLNMIYVVVLYILLNLKEVKPETITQRVSIKDRVKALKYMNFGLLLFFLSLTFMTIGAINLSKYIDVYFDELGYNPQDLGTFVMTTGIVSLGASLFIVPIFAKFKKQILSISIIQLLSAIIIFYVFRSSHFLLMMYTVFMIYVVFKAVYQPLEQSYIAGFAKHNAYGSLMGLRQSFVSVGMVIGPLVGGFLYERNPVLLFDFSAYAFILGVVLLYFVHIIVKKNQLKASN